MFCANAMTLKRIYRNKNYPLDSNDAICASEASSISLQLRETILMRIV